MKLKELRLEKGLFAKQLGLQVGLHEADVSKLEHYKFLPTPETMKRLCIALGAKPTDIYEPGEMTLYAPETPAKEQAAPKKRRKTKGEYYNFHVMVPKAWQKPLLRAIRKLGYVTIHNWLITQVNELIKGEMDNAVD